MLGHLGHLGQLDREKGEGHPLRWSATALADFRPLAEALTGMGAYSRLDGAHQALRILRLDWIWSKVFSSLLEPTRALQWGVPSGRVLPDTGYPFQALRGSPSHPDVPGRLP